MGLYTAFIFSVNAQHVSGRIEAAIVVNANEDSWQDKGIGQARASEDGLLWQQGILLVDYNLSSNWQLKSVLNSYADGEKHIGFTQAYAQYKPLSPSKIRFKGKVGMFYPAMSVENTDEGWLSPYTYTQSAINSWIGEEMRIFGVEASWFSNGRKRRSPWSWEANLGVYKGNDPFGSLLTWRGFTMHDRQSLHNDIVQFAPIPSVSDPQSFASPTWVPVFSEVDKKWGMYAGVHLSYLRTSNLRYYYYDNLANPKALNEQRIYAWHTKFHSLALQHQINPRWRFLAQIMDGSTLMGPTSVYAEYTAAYAMVSRSQNKHRTSARLDYYNVDENDIKPQDPNDSHGSGITLAWRHQYSDNIELGAEYHLHRSDVANRALINRATDLSQTHMRLVLAYVF